MTSVASGAAVRIVARSRSSAARVSLGSPARYSSPSFAELKIAPAGSAVWELIDLRRQDEVVSRQTGRRVGGERERGAAPTELDLGVVTLRLGDQRGPRNEPERVPEVRERELAAQCTVSVALPVGHLGRERRRLVLGDRRRARRADLAMSLG